ncbi:hypothetical protein GCM10011391_27510 [Pullulanibacillus camelliae]|uniref:Uncharacterized protein n=1 Tax=Pullulanibacillus camelliae TaxID=1707096 RepID=A0A8J3DWP1_9BACL|nr:hypothetical protein [Pullulanibacillus camelliae]GGE47178.1 hypothetical protein GCM10011391_27510 [Pullulanibacillus camelliae]
MITFVIIAIFVVIWAFIGGSQAIKSKQDHSPVKPSLSQPVSQSHNPMARQESRTTQNVEKVDAKDINEEQLRKERDVQREWIQEARGLQNVVTRQASYPMKSIAASPYRLTKRKIAESFIISECIDKPRALRPHPLAKEYQRK